MTNEMSMGVWVWGRLGAIIFDNAGDYKIKSIHISVHTCHGSAQLDCSHMSLDDRAYVLLYSPTKMYFLCPLDQEIQIETSQHSMVIENKKH